MTLLIRIKRYLCRLEDRATKQHSIESVQFSGSLIYLTITCSLASISLPSLTARAKYLPMLKIFIDWCVAGDSTIDKRLEIIEKQRETVEQQISEMIEHLNVLKYKTWYYETAKEGGSCVYMKRYH